MDAYLIVRGFDQRSSVPAGRPRVWGERWWPAALASLRFHRGQPLYCALIDAKTGDVLWFTKTPSPLICESPKSH